MNGGFVAPKAENASPVVRGQMDCTVQRGLWVGGGVGRGSTLKTTFGVTRLGLGHVHDTHTTSTWLKFTNNVNEK